MRNLTAKNIGSTGRSSGRGWPRQIARRVVAARENTREGHADACSDAHADGNTKPNPNLSGAPPPTGDGSMEISLPLLLSGGLAAVIVVGIYGMRLLWAGQRQKQSGK